MKHALTGLAAVGLLIGAGVARAETALMPITPQNIKGSTFTLTSRAGRNDTVEFVIRRDIRGIDGPGRQAYISGPADSKGLGTLVKLEEDPNKTLTYRFTVPEAKVKDSVFTLWGQGARGEGVTFRFKLGEFWKPPSV